MHRGSRHHLLAALFLCGACAGAPRKGHPDDPEAGRLPPNARSCVPLLGAPFGELRTLEAIPAVVLVESKSGGREKIDQELRVLRIDGEPAPPLTTIPWTYGGWHAQHERDAGKHGFVIEPGRRYELRGYETGYWFGVPPAAPVVLMDEFGPPQMRNLGFHFRSVFRVLDGTRLDDDDDDAGR